MLQKSLFLPFPNTTSISISLPVHSSKSRVIISLLPNSINGKFLFDLFFFFFFFFFAFVIQLFSFLSFFFPFYIFQTLDVPLGCTTVPPVLSLTQPIPIELPESMVHPHLYPSSHLSNATLFGGLSPSLQLGYVPISKTTTSNKNNTTENYIQNYILENTTVPTNASLKPFNRKSGGSNFGGSGNSGNSGEGNKDMNVRFMKMHTSKYWKKQPTVDHLRSISSSVPKTVKIKTVESKMSKNVPKECTDFPVGSTIEIEVFNVNDNDNNNDTGTINSDSDSDGSTSSLSSVHYIGRVLSNTLMNNKNNSFFEASEINYDSFGNAHLIIGSIFYMTIQTTELKSDTSQTVATSNVNNVNNVNNAATKKKKKKKKSKKNVKKAKKTSTKSIYVTRILKMVVIQESEKDDLDTYINYLHPSNHTCVSLPAMSSNERDLYHLPINYPSIQTSTTSTTSIQTSATLIPLLPTPSGFTKKGEPYYYNDEENIDNNNNDDNDVSVVGYTTLGSPLYVKEGDWLPTPCGFTPIGIPYYSASEIVKNKYYYGLRKITVGEHNQKKKQINKKTQTNM